VWVSVGAWTGHGATPRPPLYLYLYAKCPYFFQICLDISRHLRNILGMRTKPDMDRVMTDIDQYLREYEDLLISACGYEDRIAAAYDKRDRKSVV